VLLHLQECRSCRSLALFLVELRGALRRRWQPAMLAGARMRRWARRLEDFDS
jgi:hypothetical protein